MKYIRPINNSDSTEKILIILQGDHHLYLYQNVVRALQAYDVYVFIENKLPSTAFIKKVFYLSATLISDMRYLYLNLHTFDLVITTYGVPHDVHARYLRVITLSEKAGIPVLEIQHGMFQLGINIYESAPLIGVSHPCSLSGASKESFVQSSHQLLWCDRNNGQTKDTIIGFPPFFNDNSLQENRSRDINDDFLCETVIITNLHWSILEPEERKIAYANLLDLIKNNPQDNFVWLPHPAELKNSYFLNTKSSIARLGIKNLSFSSLKKISNKEISNFSKAICSVGSSLLSLEMANIPTIVIHSNAQQEMIRMMDYAYAINIYDNLLDSYSAITDDPEPFFLNSGMLETFKPNVLKDRIINEIKHTKKTPAERLSAIKPDLAKLF